ncbi:hypothetical protein AB0G00_18270 [Nocardia salmonicida]|uniref:hypothetical protein n=1 Tax=Nocardia salmonicida TaxID=53431 RepID=UPI0033D4A973
MTAQSGDELYRKRAALQRRWDDRDRAHSNSRIVDHSTASFREAYYAEDSRRRQRAQEEFDARSWEFVIDPVIDEWARAWVVGVPAALPLRRSTFPDWADLLGFRSHDFSIDMALVALVDRAVTDGVMRFPCQGVVATAFSSRHPYTELTDGVGYGFYPDDAEELIVHGSAAVRYEDFDSRPEYGPGAVVAAIRMVHDTFQKPRPGHRQPGRYWQPTE